MKNCPNCGTQYTDDTLQFCLQDGARLAVSSGSGPAAYDEFETSPSGRGRTSGSRDWEESQITRVSSIEPRSFKSALVVIAAALVMLVILGAAGIGIWLYLYRENSNGSVNSVTRTENSNLIEKSTSPSPSATQRSNTNSPSNNANDAYPPIDNDRITRDISQKIIAWKSASESLDLESHMSNYAATVDYYRQRNAPRAFVRRDKQRAFTKFDSIRINIGDIGVSVDPTGKIATAVFDKEWVFDGASRSSGKVRSQLRFHNIDGEWMITGERDVKVYYVH